MLINEAISFFVKLYSIDALKGLKYNSNGCSPLYNNQYKTAL